MARMWHMAVAAAVALGLGTAGIPAYASTGDALGATSSADRVVSDTQTGDSQTGQQGSVGDQPKGGKDAMPDNPTQKLPDQVSAAVPDDATVVAPDLAVTDGGKVTDLKTGTEVADPTVVGTNGQQPDPLAKTDGHKFIPVKAKEVKKAVQKNGGDSNAPQGSDGNTGTAGTAAYTGTPTVRSAALQNNQYGAYWGTYNGTPAFFEGGGNLFAQQAKGVIDVSSWQGNINWQAVKNSGVEGAIIRISYGWNNSPDSQAARNISECKRLGIPFGIYTYSYAANSNDGASEGRDVLKWLRNYGVSPSNLSYPVFYDLEAWTDGGRSRPTSPNVYDGIVNSWYSQLQSSGYNNLSVYSYTYYLNTALNSGNIHGKTRWVASYGSRTGFNYSANDRGWQYADNGRISGISGNVDINAFGNRNYVSTAPNIGGYRAAAIANNKYFISSSARDSAGFDIPAASRANNAPVQLYSANGSGAQQFSLTRYGDNSFEIRNVNSGKVLDVPAANAYQGAPVQQYDANGSNAQRWYLRDAGNGGMYIQSKLGNWVLDLPAANTGNNTKFRLWEPNFTKAQQFIFSTVSSVPSGSVRVSSKVNSNQVFDIPAASTADNAHLQVYAWNGTNAQKYQFRSVGNAIYEIKNVNSGKVVDLGAANTRNGSWVDQYSRNNSCAQHWAIRELSRGQYGFYSACAADNAIDLPGANSANNTGLQIYSSNSSAAQLWTLSKTPTARDELNSLAAGHRGDLADGTYTFAAKDNHSMMLDVAAASRSNNASVRLFAKNGTGAQKWRVRHDGSGYVTLTNTNSGKALDVPAAQNRPDVAVQQYQSNGTYAQKWIAVRSGNAVKLVSAMNKSLVLDIQGDWMVNQTRVQLFTDNNSNAQRWVPVATR